MDFLNSNQRFTFTYGGKAFNELELQVDRSEGIDSLKTVYTLPDGLKVTNTAKKYEDFGAYEWVNNFENASNMPTEIVSELWDCCCDLPLEFEEPRKWQAFAPDPEKATKIYAPAGSTWDEYEFYSNINHLHDNYYTNHILTGRTKVYSTSGGRSSDKNAPFFNIHKNGKGYIVAIGWTGQWKCEMTRNEESITVKAKIEDTSFRIKPGESFRTCSIIIMPYEGSFEDGQNKWRRFLKEHISIIGKPGRDTKGPLCTGFWGGLESETVIERVKNIAKHNLPFEYIWMDAGWYGADTKPTDDDFGSDWSRHTGDWIPSPLIHKNGLKDVSKAIHESGKKFILWFEPERAVEGTPITKEHPEYFITLDNSIHQLLNLGNEKAWEYCFNTVAGLIEEIGVDLYRQDFNVPPLDYWRKNDTEDRRVMTEIKHINGLYKFWDALLERFPHLMIDNCASGGRRIDIEMLKRSITLWRTDYACPANFRIEGVQNHHINFNTWVPYTGTGAGRFLDEYRIRSSYSSSMTTNFFFSKSEPSDYSDEDIKLMRKYIDEYLSIRPFFYEDIYKLTDTTGNPDTWCAVQFDRPSEKDGIVQVFRRESSPYETATLAVKGIDIDCNYTFTDIDGEDEFTVSGKELIEIGLTITVSEKRKAKIYCYKAV